MLIVKCIKSATSYNNEPGLSSVEFVLDPQTMKLYASSEKGTEKCVHIAKNPKVVLYWYKQIPEEEYIAYKMIISTPTAFRSKVQRS